jgi:transposase InsO family protein
LPQRTNTRSSSAFTLTAGSEPSSCSVKHSRLYVSLDDARALIEGWREDYNTIRPHTSLRGLSPEEFLRASSEGSPSGAAPTSAQSHVNPSTHELAGRT